MVRDTHVRWSTHQSTMGRTGVRLELILMLLGTSLGLAPVIQAAPAGPYLVKDINQLPAPEGSNPSHLTALDGKVYFSADDGVNGQELWASDGTEEGTIMVKDIKPGASGSGLSDITNVGGTLFFAAYSNESPGVELWRSDGTEEGTVMLREFPSAYGGYSIGNRLELLTNVGGTLLFVEVDVLTGRPYWDTAEALWASDGTEQGAILVRDVLPGWYSSYPGNPAGVDGTLYFSADDGWSGKELWKSDGTYTGTVRVADITPGVSSSSFGSLANVNGTLYFNADDGMAGAELWRSGGTDWTTMPVADISPGGGSSEPGHLTVAGGTLFFVADNGTTGRELWALDLAVRNPLYLPYIGAATRKGNVLLLHFDEPAGSTTFRDASGQCNHGTLAGGACPISGASGVIGTAVRFDGLDDYVALGNPASLDIRGEITIEAWVKLEAANGLCNIVARGYTMAPDGEVFLRVADWEYEVGSWDGVSHNCSYRFPARDVGQWVHLVGAYDGAVWRLYRNGVEVSLSDNATGAIHVNEDWAVGARGTGTERFFRGLIDEVAIYDRALAPQEVLLHYQQTVAE